MLEKPVTVEVMAIDRGKEYLPKSSQDNVLKEQCKHLSDSSSTTVKWDDDIDQESPPKHVSCPICGMALGHLDPSERNSHTNLCLDNCSMDISPKSVTGNISDTSKDIPELISASVVSMKKKPVSHSDRKKPLNTAFKRPEAHSATSQSSAKQEDQLSQAMDDFIVPVVAEKKKVQKESSRNSEPTKTAEIFLKQLKSPPANKKTEIRFQINMIDSQIAELIEKKNQLYKKLKKLEQTQVVDVVNRKVSLTSKETRSCALVVRLVFGNNDNSTNTASVAPLTSSRCQACPFWDYSKQECVKTLVVFGEGESKMDLTHSDYVQGEESSLCGGNSQPLITT